MALAFLVGLQLARGLGTSGYGIYAFAFSLMSLAGLVSEFGIPQVALRESSAASATEDWSRLIGVAIFSSLGVAALSVVLAIVYETVLAYVGPIDVEKRHTIEWSLLLIPLVAETKTLSYMMMGIGRIVLSQSVNLVLRPGLFVVALAAIAWVSHTTITPHTAMSLQVVSAGISLVFIAVLFLWFLPKAAKSARPTFDVRNWLGAAWPMAMTEGLRVAQGQLSMLLIGLLSTNAEVGLFRVADSTAQVCGFAVSLFNFVSISMFARFWAGREMEKLQKIASATTAGILVGAIVLSLPVVLFGYPLLSLFFGKSFAPAYPALIILCGGGLVYGIFGLSGSLLNMTGNERCVTRAIALALVGSVTLAVVLVPLLGAVGGAIANVAGLTIWNISTWRDAKNRVGVDTSILAAVRVLKARWL